MIQLDVDFSKKASDPCALPAPGIVPGSRRGMQEPWRFTCAEKLQIINGLLALVMKALRAVTQDAGTEIKASCTGIIRENCCPRARRRAGMCQELPRNRGLGGAVPGQGSCAGALHSACAAF